MTTSTADRDKIDNIKRSRDLGDYVETRGVKLRPSRGRVRQGPCPFHKEEEGSFTVYADTQRYYCFGGGCGAKGDIIQFVMSMDRCDFREALSKLQTMPDTPVRPAPRYKVAPWTGKAPETKRDMPVVCASLEFYRDLLLRGEDGQPGRDYFKGRGISRATAESLFLGYCSGSGLMAHLLSCGFDHKRILRSGFFKNGGRRERFTGMVVIPDVRNGEPLWATGRRVDDEVEPRFDALPGRKTILGLNSLPRRAKHLIVAEGVFDWLTLKEWGLTAVGLAGNGNIPRLVEQLNATMAERIILALDANEEGQAFAAKLLGHDEENPLNEHIRNVTSIDLPKGFEDIGDMATARNGRDMFLQAIA